MKNKIATLAIVAILAGCATAPTTGELTTWQTVAEDAAYVGASYDLVENPDHRAHYVLCLEALKTMVRDVNYSPAKLREAMANLPVLTGSNGALLDGGVTLFILGTGFLPVDNAPRVRAVVEGLQVGLEKALARPTGTAIRALAKPLPKQCVVPPR